MIKLFKASILDVRADIIVMSANPSLLAGGGVSGVIHKAAGPELEQFAKSHAPLQSGQSLLTPAFNLNAKYIVHTVCPRFYDGLRGEPEELKMAYLSALTVCDKLSSVSSIAFVSMGTGIYKWPPEHAAKIAVAELAKSGFDKTFMCITSESLLRIYEIALVKSQDAIN